jgi:hypothetical protein
VFAALERDDGGFERGDGVDDRRHAGRGWGWTVLRDGLLVGVPGFQVNHQREWMIDRQYTSGIGHPALCVTW